MAAPVTALQPLRLPSGPSPLTSEQRYWRSFRSQQLIPSLQNTSITHISAPITPPQSQVVSPEVFAVTSGGRVQIYSSRTGKVVKNISRFGYDDVARSGEIRPDGRVVAAGGDSGGIQVFDVNSRAILKTWKQHKQPVWSIRWSPNDLTLLMSTCDDRTVRLWDLSSQESTVTFTGHQDYVRCGAFMPGQNTNLLVSGSYDQTLRVWDKRTPDNAVMTFKYGAPLESVLPMPTGTTVLSTADNIISVVDLVAAKLLHQIRSHQKTVTSICLASNNTRLVSGGLDGHLKVHEISGWSVVAASKYPSPIISLAVIGGGIQREDKHLAVGMQSGLLSIRTRLAGQQKAQERERAKEMQALMQGTIDDYDKKTSKKQNKQGLAKRYRGVDYDGHGADIIVEGTERRKRKKLPCWDRALRNIQYGKALDLALNVEVSALAFWS